MEPTESRDASPPPIRPLDDSQVPLHGLVGLRTVETADGRGRVELVVSGQHLRMRGILHGGVIATLLDAAMGAAAFSLAPEDHDVVTVQLNVNFIRPVHTGEVLSASAEVQHSGRRTAVARGEVRTDDGALSATGSGTFMFLPLGPE